MVGRGRDPHAMRTASLSMRLPPVLLFQLIYLPSNQQTAVTSRRRLLIRFPRTLSHPHPRIFLPLTSGATSANILLFRAVGE